MVSSLAAVSFSCSTYGYSGRGEEWEEAQWKQKDKDGERNESMKIQDKEMGCWEPNTNGQILAGLFVYYSSHGKKGWEKRMQLFSVQTDIWCFVSYPVSYMVIFMYYQLTYLYTI